MGKKPDPSDVATGPSIVLVPLGDVSADLLRWLVDALEDALGQRVSAGEPIELLETWYHRRRQQYRGPALLRALEGVPREGNTRILGLADVDCYASGLNFIFGQAAPRAGVAFVALPRLRQTFYGPAEDMKRFRQRTLKEAIHELGHTWGLPHCPNPRCVMHFSNTLSETDEKSASFCQRCTRRLRTG